MSTFALLARSEWIKVARRPAAWVTIVVYTGICVLASSVILRNLRRSAEQAALFVPYWWARALSEAMPLALFMSAALVVLLVASEFSWRTARQNVIDGLSKEEWFAGKLLVVPMVALALVACAVTVAGAFSFFADAPAGAPDVRFALLDVRYIGVFLLGTVAFGALALFFSVAVRNAGPALAALFLYIVIEQLAAHLFRAAGERGAAIAEYLPAQLFTSLSDVRQWYPILRQSGWNYFDETRMILVVLGYVGALLLLSFLLVRKRDL